MTVTFNNHTRPAPSINRPRFESRTLNRTVCIDEVMDLTDTELDIVKAELGETITSLQAALDEAAALYGTQDQLDPVRYGRMRYKARILYGMQRRFTEELNRRLRLARHQASRHLSSLFMEEAKRRLAPELYAELLSAARVAATAP